MNSVLEDLDNSTTGTADQTATAPPNLDGTGQPKPRAMPVLRPWLRAQTINASRHAEALRPFRREEFGPGQAMPSEGNIQSVNQLIVGLRERLMKLTRHVSYTAARAIEEPGTAALQRL